MGYCYTREGLLCCDVCSNVGGVRKYRCPFGWCQAIALCPSCKEKHPEYTSKKYHRKQGCEKQSIQFHGELERRASMIAAGEFVRCSTLSHPEHKPLDVKVIFQGGDHKEQAYWMTDKTYHAISYDAPATPADYRKHGKIKEAKNTKIYDAELEAVPA